MNNTKKQYTPEFKQGAIELVKSGRTITGVARELGVDYFKSDFIVTYEDGSLIDPRTFSNRFTTILKRASLDVVRFHDLRHTYASLLINDGEDLKTVSEMLGHSTINITADLYSHLYDEKKRSAANKLGKYIPS